MGVVRTVGADPDLGAAAMVSLPRPLPERLAGLGVLGVAIAWSLGVALASREEILATGLPLGSALLITLAAGTFAVAGVWVGVGAVVWAMGRMLRGKAGFVRVLLAVSAAAPPLWVAVPAWSLALSGSANGMSLAALIALGTVGGWGFLALLVTTLGATEGFSARRACGCIALTTLFCASYLSLH